MTIALVDVNNFYASCERLFRPELRGRPLVVLSNNDGCVVSRSPEAKIIGVKMGVPYFKIRADFEAQGGIAFSSNYALYGDLSQRVMSTLESMSPSVEVYSIDEAFVELSESFGGDLVHYGALIRQRILQWTGLTVGVGIGPTKVLAKLANYAAKRWPATGGVVDLRDEMRRARLMAVTPVDEVWGIGRRLSLRLQSEGINTVADLVAASPKQVRQRYGVVVERVVQELRGTPCSALEVDVPAKQHIVCSRSFGERVTHHDDMGAALRGYVVRAAEKLRAENMHCQRLTCFIRTSPFNEREPFYSEQASVRLVTPTNDTRVLLQRVEALLAAIWRDGFRYQKGGVMLSEFIPSSQVQPDLFAAPDARGERLMGAIDAIKAKGLGQVRFASQGAGEAAWLMRREHLSPSYTTRWEDLPVAR